MLPLNSVCVRHPGGDVRGGRILPRGAGAQGGTEDRVRAEPAEAGGGQAARGAPRQAAAVPRARGHERAGGAGAGGAKHRHQGQPVRLHGAGKFAIPPAFSVPSPALPYAQCLRHRCRKLASRCIFVPTAPWGDPRHQSAQYQYARGSSAALGPPCSPLQLDLQSVSANGVLYASSAECTIRRGCEAY
jgi:hypothetical protein